MRVAPLLVLGIGVLAHAAHQALDGIPFPEAETAAAGLPSAPVLRAASVGQPTLMADYLWLQAVSHFGDRRMHEKGYPELPDLMRRVLSLDPKFSSGYWFSGTVLNFSNFEPGIAIELLEQGRVQRPDQWRILFLLGFNLYKEGGDPARAAEILAEAARLPEAPPMVGKLATVIAAEAGRPEIGLQLLDVLLEQVEEEELREHYEKQHALLLIELHIGWIEQAKQRYTAQHGQPPTDILQLVAPGLFTELPEEPLGGHYFLDNQGRVASSHDSERLNRDPKP